MVDGEELFAQFLNTLQDPGEKPSAYLHRLQVALNRVKKRGGSYSQRGRQTSPEAILQGLLG